MSSYITFEGVGEGSPVFERSCPECHRFLKSSAIHVAMNFFSHVRATADCPRCGEVEISPVDWVGEAA